MEQAITLRDQAPELYDLWLKIAQEKAATANYVDRAPYEVPERLAQSGPTVSPFSMSHLYGPYPPGRW